MTHESDCRHWRYWPLVAGVLLSGWVIDHFYSDIEALFVKVHVPAKRTEITNVLNRQKAAWNDGDLANFMGEYWQSDELTFYSGGTVTGGWQATFDRYKKRYQSDGKDMGTLAFDDIAVEVLGPDAALVCGKWKLAYAKSDEKPHGLFTLVMKRFPDGWKIVHDHTSIADPPKKPE
jgi:ketosteroid isomerase-like protein